MKAKRRLIVNYFLYGMHDKMKWDDTEEGISTRWLAIFDTKELKDIVSWLFMGEPPKEMDLDNLSKEGLLATIGFDYHILGYLLSQMEQELQTLDEPTNESISQILGQLSLHNHYLRSKPIKEWDSYDYSNYRSLCQKAGVALPLYGVFSKDVTNQDKYIYGANTKLYSTREKAQKVLEQMQQKSGESSQLQIMIL